MADDDDDFFGGFDIPEDVAALPSTAAGELDLLIGAEEVAEDSILAGAKPMFDPEAPAYARFRITGNTYDVKEKLKALGCRFDGQRRCWVAANAVMYQEACRIRDTHTPPPKAKRCGTFTTPSPAQQPLPPPKAPAPAQASAPAPARKRTRTPMTVAPAEMVPVKDIPIAEDGGPDLEEMGFNRDGSQVPKYDPEAEAAAEQKKRSEVGQVKAALKKASDDQLAEELRARGFEVRAYTIEEKLAREGVDIGATDELFEELEHDES
jgi:hypothetical protein